MYIESQLGVVPCIKSFDALVPIGTAVMHHGVKRKTWSHAGRGVKNVPSVFLDDDGPPVPLHELEIPGVEMVSQRRKSGESSGKGQGRKNVEFQLFGHISK